MSRIGKQPINIPEGVEVKIENKTIIVKGPKGELVQKVCPRVLISQTGRVVKVEVENPEDKSQRALWGLFNRLVNNMIQGVTSGFEKKLEIIGIGYKAVLEAGKLILNLGYSHPIIFKIPKGIEIKVEKDVITISGVDKQLVGQAAAEIRAFRKPEPYKGKGIKYFGEIVRRKAGKATKAVGMK